MSCYHPLLGSYYVDANTGERKTKISSLVNEDYFGNKVKRDWNEIKSFDPDAFLVPCGKCLGCRLDYSRRWADRMMLELESNDNKAIFVTLTYDDDHLVDYEGNHITDGYGSLYKPHLQLFMKRLRDKYGYGKIRFFGVGEYGSWQNTHRPHYHVILFGIGLDDLENKIPVGYNELRQTVYTDNLISSCWDHGFISCGDVSWKSCAYVARYVTKKAIEPESDLLNEAFNLNPLFSVMSRKPGIAAPYMDEHPDCLDYVSIFVSDSDGQKKIAIPKYFVNRLKLQDPEKGDNIIAQRSLYAQDAMMAKLSQTDLPLLDYLELEEELMYKKIKSLRRSI